MLTRNMALFFVPAGVGLMAEYNIIARNWAALLVVSIVTTILVMIVVGYVQEKVEVRTRRHLHIGKPFK
ncbi:MAG: CidA/LrgA family protein [Barnesiella sp.]